MNKQWKEEMETKLIIFKKNREMQNKTRLTHEDYIEFFKDFISTNIINKQRYEKS